MRFRSEVALASIAAAAISCGKSRSVERSEEHVVVAGQPLSLSDDGSGKGDITIDLSRMSFVECSASAGGTAPSDGASAQVGIASSGTLSGSLRLHVSVDRHGQGAVSSIALSILPDVSSVVATQANGAGSAVFLPVTVQAVESSPSQGSNTIAGSLRTTLRGANLQRFQTNVALTGLLAASGMAAAVAAAASPTAQAAADTVTSMSTTSVLLINVSVTVSRTSSSSGGSATIVSAQLTTVTSSCDTESATHLLSCSLSADGGQDCTASSSASTHSARLQ